MQVAPQPTIHNMEDEVKYTEVKSYRRRKVKAGGIPKNIRITLPNYMGLKSGQLSGHIRDISIDHQYSLGAVPIITLRAEIIAKYKKI